MEQLDGFLDSIAHMPTWLACASILLMSLLSEDVAVIGAGLAAASNTLPQPIALATSVASVWLGDIALWWIGHSARTSGLSRLARFRLVDPATVERCQRELHERKLAWILITRVLPGSRSPTYVLAGALGIPLRWFATVTLLAVACWTPVLFYAASWLGADALALASRLGAAAWCALAAVAGTALVWRKIVRRRSIDSPAAGR